MGKTQEAETKAEVKTEANAEATVEEVEISPDEFDGKEEAKAESETANQESEEKSEETDKPQKAEESDKDSKETDSEPDDKPEKESQDETEETKPQSKADERKAELNTEIRGLVKERKDLLAQRNALRTEVEKANAEAYQVDTEEELIERGVNPTEAKVEALNQAMQMRDYNEKVAEAQLVISNEAQRVLDDFPIFNPSSELYNEELSNETAQLLEANLVQDPNSGQIIGSNVSPYQLYKTIAKAHEGSAVAGQIQGKQDAEKMMANADSVPSKSPGKKTVNELEELWSGDL